MGVVLGRKPEHETLCFSVSSGCSRRWKVPRVCGGCGCGRFIRELVPPLCSATSGCSCVRSSKISGCRSDRIGMAAWLLSVGAAMCVERCGLATWFCKTHCRSTKPCVFPCLQPAMKGTSCVRRVRCGRCGSFYVFCNEVCVVLCGSHCRSTKPCVFPCKVAAAGDERYLVCAAGAAAVVVVPSMCFATSGCSCVRSSMRFLKLWLQIAL